MAQSKRKLKTKDSDLAKSSVSSKKTENEGFKGKAISFNDSSKAAELFICDLDAISCWLMHFTPRTVLLTQRGEDSLRDMGAWEWDKSKEN